MRKIWRNGKKNPTFGKNKNLVKWSTNHLGKPHTRFDLYFLIPGKVDDSIRVLSPKSRVGKMQSSVEVIPPTGA